jgi:hypothetical protein
MGIFYQKIKNCIVSFHGSYILPGLVISLFFAGSLDATSIKFVEKSKNSISEHETKKSKLLSNTFGGSPILSLEPSNYNGYNISCNGANNGSIELTIIGGEEPFNILWSTGDTTDEISNLIAGLYTVRVIDANSDTTESSIDLIQPDNILINIDTIANNICFGESNGFIDLNVQGGVPTYSFLWSNGFAN